MDVTWMDLFGRKLSVAAAAAVVLSGVLGVFCVLQLARVNQAATHIASRSLPSVKALSDIATNTANFRLAEFQHILSTSDEERAQYERAMDVELEHIESNQAIYEPLIASPEERARYAEFMSLWSDYMLEHVKAMERSADGRRDEARTLLEGRRGRYFEADVKLLALPSRTAERGRREPAWRSRLQNLAQSGRRDGAGGRAHRRRSGAGGGAAGQRPAGDLGPGPHRGAVSEVAHERPKPT